MYDLTFDPERYEVKTCELGNWSITHIGHLNILFIVRILPVKFRH